GCRPRARRPGQQRPPAGPAPRPPRRRAGAPDQHDGGILSQTGINGAGLGLFGSFVVSANWRFALPSRNFVRRHVLEQPTIDAAVAAMSRLSSRASGHNVMLADRSGRVADIESTPEDFRVLGARDGLLAHTNHYCHPELAPRDALRTSSLADFADDSHRRLARVHSRLAALPARVTSADVQALLRDHEGHPKSVCRHPDGDPTETLSACSVVLVPDAREMSVTVGNPCERAPVWYRL
ncbi:MAG: C45 family autoproteolytic acyltransferase/hydrolase, partial [Geminicoccales bacterium]